MNSHRMWGELAKYYDLLYSWKDYGKEAQKVHTLIQKYKQSTGNSLLEVACGTGGHIGFFKKHYRVIGTDLNGGMLAVARKKHPDVRFVATDMVSLSLGKTFDAVTCLFSAIPYAKTYSNLRKTIRNFSRHLKTGGVLIIEPYFTRKTYRPGNVSLSTINHPEVKIARVGINKMRGDMAIQTYHFLIATRKGVSYLTDIHELGLFDTEKFLRIMEENGLKARFLKRGILPNRGLFVGVKG